MKLGITHRLFLAILAAALLTALNRRISPGSVFEEMLQRMNP